MNYSDCKKCKHTFGESQKCNTCEYYKNSMIEYEIDKVELEHDRELENYLNRLENEEYPL